MDTDDSMDLAAVYALLEELRDAGAFGASAIFLTEHGLVSVTVTRDGRVMTVNGLPVPMAGL